MLQTEYAVPVRPHLLVPLQLLQDELPVDGGGAPAGRRGRHEGRVVVARPVRHVASLAHVVAAEVSQNLKGEEKKWTLRAAALCSDELCTW